MYLVFVRDYSWNLADHFLANCTDFTENIGLIEAEGEGWSPSFPGFSEYLDLGASILD